MGLKLRSTAGDESGDCLAGAFNLYRGLCNANYFSLIVGFDSYVPLGNQVCTALVEPNNCHETYRYTMRGHVID